MNILMDELPYTVDIAGQTVPINTDYRTGIYFEQCLAGKYRPASDGLGNRDGSDPCRHVVLSVRC